MCIDTAPRSVASPLVTAFTRWTQEALLELEQRILVAITSNVAEAVTFIGESTEGASTTAVIGATLAERERLLGVVQAAIAEKAGTAYAAAPGVNIDFSTRVTAT